MVRSNNSDRTPQYTVTQSRTEVMRGQNHERKRQFGMGMGMGIGVGGWWLRTTLTTVLLLSCAIGSSNAADMAYCSSLNTAASSSPMTDTFQSNGLCTNYCEADYAFAILQGSKCWCSNYAPSSTTTGCTQACPGYGQETCGSVTKNVFGYIALSNVPPSGTVGSTSSTASSTSSSSTSTTSAPTTTTTSTTSSSSSSTSTTETPSLSVITSVGGVRTVTYIPETTASATATAEPSSSGDSFFSQPGRVAGVFVGVALLVIAIVGALMVFCYRRNKQRNSMHGGPEAAVIPAGGAGVMAGRRRSRSLSTLGLMGEKGFHSVDTAPSTGPPNMAGLNGVGTAAARGPDGTKLVDQRLDPSQLYLRYDPDTGSSRMSVRSLRDDADYSRRVLRLANPDD